MSTIIDKNNLREASWAIKHPEYVSTRCCGARSILGHCKISQNDTREKLDVMDDLKWKCECCKGYSTLVYNPYTRDYYPCTEYDYSDEEY